MSRILALQRVRTAEDRLLSVCSRPTRSDVSIGIAWIELLTARSAVLDADGAPALPPYPELSAEFRPDDLTTSLVLQIIHQGK